MCGGRYLASTCYLTLYDLTLLCNIVHIEMLLRSKYAWNMARTCVRMSKYVLRGYYIWRELKNSRFSYRLRLAESISRHS